MGKASRRDLPSLCMIFCVIFGAAAIALPFGANLDLAKESDLRSTSGLVEDVYRTNRPKAGPKLHILIRMDGRLHHLTQDDLSQDVPALLGLEAGDSVTARVKGDFLGRDLEWLWELQRDGVTILSYEDTFRFVERRNARTREAAHWAGLFALGLFVVAILLRMHFGVWRDAPRK
jgi:hypothetical protein